MTAKAALAAAALLAAPGAFALDLEVSAALDGAAPDACDGCAVPGGSLRLGVPVSPWVSFGMEAGLLAGPLGMDYCFDHSCETSARAFRAWDVQASVEVHSRDRFQLAPRLFGGIGHANRVQCSCSETYAYRGTTPVFGGALQARFLVSPSLFIGAEAKVTSWASLTSPGWTGVPGQAPRAVGRNFVVPGFSVLAGWKL